MAGSSLVYQASRYRLADLLTIAWLWTIIGGIPVWFILKAFSLIPPEFSNEVLGLALISSIITINQNLFLGKEQIRNYNLMAVVQSIILLFALIILVLLYKWYKPSAYVISQFISMSIIALIGTIMNLPPLKTFKIPQKKVILEAFRYGGFLQTANIMQLFNYRLSYYLIEKFFDRATLGVFSLGVQLAESIWIISRSMAVLLYSRLSNVRDQNFSINLTVNFIKVAAIATTLLIGIVVLLPSDFFVIVFQSEFEGIVKVFSSLAPGIIAISISLMFSHYFSGNGTPHYNTISSGIGLILTICLGLILIPLYGVIGAGITSSLSYISSMLYQLFVFKRKTRIKWFAFIPVSSDYGRVIAEIRTTFKKV